jgi:DNA modification methylase
LRLSLWRKWQLKAAHRYRRFFIFKSMELINRNEGQYLPDSLDDLAKFVLVGRDQLAMVRAGIKALNKLDVAEGVRRQKREEAQMLAEALLDAEVKIGEILKAMPKATGTNNQYVQKVKMVSAEQFHSKIQTKQEAAKSLGFNEMQVKRFQTLADNKDIVEQIKQEAREADDLPTRTAVLQAVKFQERIEARSRKAEEGAKIKNIDIDFRHGDFESVFSDLPDGSIDCIITDPPYPHEFIECWTKLARFAKRVLKPNGYCIAYSGQMYLPEVMFRMSEHLDYYWTFCVYHEGQTQIVNGVNLICRWKPVLVFQNGKKKIPNTIQDYFISEGREKDGHDWQQSKSGVSYLIERFTEPGQTVFEPFAGSGTTIIACKALNRNVIAAEIDETTYNIAKSNL